VIVETFDNGTPTPCGYIRLVLPLRWTAHSLGFPVEFVTASEISGIVSDVIIWQRYSLGSTAVLRELEKRARKTGARLIYDIDDQLWDVGELHPEHEFYQNRRDVVLDSLSVADEVWVSTSMLYDAVIRKSPSAVRRVPNALCPSIWAAAKETKEETRCRLRLLYAATKSHAVDFHELIAPAFSKLKKTVGDSVTLDVIGLFDHGRPDDPWNTIPTPAHSYCYPIYARWLQGLGRHDCGLAALTAASFNHCKSNIKWQEYSAMGLATIGSALPPYREGTLPGKDILLVPPTSDGFRAGIESLASQSERLNEFKSAARSSAKRMIDLVERSMPQSAALQELLGLDAEISEPPANSSR
jgi:hypothetical protein